MTPSRGALPQLIDIRMTIYRSHLVDEPSLFNWVSGMPAKNFSFFFAVNAIRDYQGLLAHIARIIECDTEELSNVVNL